MGMENLLTSEVNRFFSIALAKIKKFVMILLSSYGSTKTEENKIKKR